MLPTGIPPASAPPVLRVLVADDTAEVREELRRLLPLLAPVEVVGEAANGLEALQLAEALAPDAVIMDLEMPVLDGYAAARRIKQVCPGCRVVALSIHSDEADCRKALLAGADTFVAKGAPLEALLHAILGGRLAPP